MSNLKGLPAFFQNTGKTVLDELTSFELEPGANNDDDDALLNNLDMAQLDDDTFGDEAFGDLKTDNLPSFFTTKSPQNDGLDILSSFSAFKVAYEEPVESARPAPASIYSQPLPQTGPNVYHSAPPGFGAKVTPPPPPGMTPIKSAAAAPSTASPAVPPPALTQVKKSGGLPVPKTFSAAAVAGTTPSAPADAAAPAKKSAFPTPKPYSAAVSGNTTNSTPSAAAAPTATSPVPAAAAAAAAAASAVPSATSPSPNPLQTMAPAANTFSAKTEHKRAKCMHPSDIRFIVGKVIQPLQTSDPFSDDFYFLQLSIKKNNKMREAALKAQQEAPPMIYVPLPTWKETKERIKSQMDATRKGFQQKSREWEEKEQVLGHQVRTDFSKPREVLRMPTLSELDLAGDVDEEGAEGSGGIAGEYKTPFTSRLWTIRAAVQRGFDALYTVQELHHLLSSPVVVSNPLATEEILREIDAAVALLSQAIGIRTTQIAGRHDFSLDGGHVAAILQTPKGKQLMSRSMKLLAPEHRWALLPVILARIFMNNNNPSVAPTPSTSAKLSAAAQASAAAAAATAAELSAENTKVEHKLLKTIIEFLQFSFQFQIQQQNMAPPGVPAEFTNVLLSNLRQCMKSVLVTQIEKSKLRTALMSDRIRAEVMHMIVQIGDKVSTVSDLRLREDWIQTREAFMSTLDS